MAAGHCSGSISMPVIPLLCRPPIWATGIATSILPPVHYRQAFTVHPISNDSSACGQLWQPASLGNPDIWYFGFGPLGGRTQANARYAHGTPDCWVALMATSCAGGTCSGVPEPWAVLPREASGHLQLRVREATDQPTSVRPTPPQVTPHQM